MELRVISIGTLSHHPLWGERIPVRTGHATTTLLRSGERTILVDPGLPGQALSARLGERRGLRPEQVTDVFLTSFRPETTRGLDLFEHATWWISADERESVGVALASRLRDEAQRGESGDRGLIDALTRDLALLRRCKPAPDTLAPHVDLFPVPGVSPGMCGLLVEHPRHTIVVCGDAAPTIEHVEQGMVLSSIHDVERARQSLGEIIEIADLLIPGRDDLVVNPTKRPF